MWEYKIIKDKGFDYLSVVNELNTLAKYGWELIATTAINANGSTVWVSYTLKRNITT